jgi:uncharacterized protein (DUF427 family)
MLDETRHNRPFASAAAATEGAPHLLKEYHVRKEIRIPGPDHAITIAPTDQHVTVHVGEHAIAESDTALTLSEAGYAPVQYVPIGDVDTTSIEPSDTETYCPYKGDATYYSISLPDSKIKDAIWTYVSPYESVKEIAGHVAFYDGTHGITVDVGD